jgi:hypothetical protein
MAIGSAFRESIHAVAGDQLIAKDLSRSPQTPHKADLAHILTPVRLRPTHRRHRVPSLEAALLHWWVLSRFGVLPSRQAQV